MRQAGVLAAAGIYALQNNIDRLADDHRRAKRLASGLQELGYPSNTPLSNMVYVDVKDGPKAQDALSAQGVRCLHVSPTTLRLVTHLDVDDAGIDQALAGFSKIRDQLCP